MKQRRGRLGFHRRVREYRHVLHVEYRAPPVIGLRYKNRASQVKALDRNEGRVYTTSDERGGLEARGSVPLQPFAALPVTTLI